MNKATRLEVRNRKEGYLDQGYTTRVVEPLGESRSDWQFYLDLAVKMGYGADFGMVTWSACLKGAACAFRNILGGFAQ